MVDELQAALPTAAAGSFSRLDWLTQHLNLYVERLVGFAASPNVPVPPLVAGDLFTCVTLCAELLQAEIQMAPRSAELTAAWSHFQLALGEVPRVRQSTTIAKLQVATLAWASTLGAQRR